MIVGLTGGIGSGKTTVLTYFKSLGAAIYVADVEAKKIMVADASVIKSIKKLLGDEAYIGGELNRAYIAEKVFKDKTLLTQLNQIVHPAVHTHFKKFAKEQQDTYVVYESAILLESKYINEFNYIVVVVADDDKRIERVMLRDGLTRDQIEQRMKHQWSQEKSKEQASFLIENNERNMLKIQVEAVHQQIIDLMLKN